MSKLRWKYFAVYSDTGVKAMPAGPKKVIENFAAFITDPTTGTARDVCIKKFQPGGVGDQDTGVCYIGGVRKKRRAVRKIKP